MILNAFVILWLAGACAVLGLAIYRKLVSRLEDDNLHVREFDAPQVAQQAVIAARLDFVDKWGIALTIAVVAFGVLLAGIYVYHQWTVSAQLVP
jgi:hypothetical protein